MQNTSHFRMDRTRQPLEDSHWDVQEAFPDADGQLGKTSLEEESNWQNNEGSQFMKWDGWDYSEEGNLAKTR